MKAKRKNKMMKTLMLVLILSIGIFFPKTVVKATSLSENELLKFQNYTISKTTTIDQITKQFGEAKIKGNSAFGGFSYSYYDEDYTWYLHIETDQNGIIKGYGCINGNFVSQRYTMNDDYNYSYSYLSGSAIQDDTTNKVLGIYEYNATSTEVQNYTQKFVENSDFLYDLQKHTIPVSKILAKKNNDSFPQTYMSEDLFYLAEQLKDQGTDLYEYARKNGKTKYISLISSGYSSVFSQYLPNPIELGKHTENYSKEENYQYIYYDIKISSTSPMRAQETYLFIDPDFLQKKNSVTLTTAEKKQLENVKIQYGLFKQHLEESNQFYQNNSNSHFEITPNYKTLPLIAGKWSDASLQASTDYLNIARVGLGLSPLTLNKEIADAAQHKATLIMYMNNYMENSNGNAGHLPTKPEGVSDAFYNKAQSYMNENLFHGNIQVSITTALNDAYGDPVECGHRYNLLNPNYTEWGVGSVGSGTSFGWQGVHKFSGYVNSTNELVAWPSNGIFPLDLVSNGIGNWTAQFYKNYKVTSETEVTIQSLTTGKTYEITQQNKNSSGKLLKTTGDRLLTFRDDSIVYESEDVFEITLHNIIDNNDNTVDYSYRSVFLSLSDTEKVEATSISLDKKNMEIEKGESQKLTATITPDNTTNKILHYSSSNEKVATVRQDGKITAVGYGSAIITVTSENGKIATCNITVPTRPITGVTLSKSSLTVEKGATSTLTATITPANTTDSKTLTWTSSNTSVASVDATGKVTAKGYGTTTITVKTSNGKTAQATVKVVEKVPNVSYRTHVQDYGWQDYVKNGSMSGTEGKAKRLEGINIKLDNLPYSGGITYRTHIENIGWESEWKTNGTMSGTEGKAYRLEAIQINLTGEMATHYDIYYRVHAEIFGWLDWAKNGEKAGTAGYAYRLEGIEIVLVEKGAPAPGETKTPYEQKYIHYQTHVENEGWQAYKYDGEMSGTEGKAYRLEGIRIGLDNQEYSGNIEYRTHIEDYGWEKSFKKNGKMSGTSGEAKRLEAIEIKLTGEMAEHYDIYYRVHAENFGWLDWAKNGEQAGTAGYAYRLEGIEIVLVKKGASAPGKTTHPFFQKSV